MRKILCGNASHFQGDERDVIFLSVVDSVTKDHPAPIHLQGFGVNDAYRKRYNVAASRARDQLWVVDSLDSTTDLKPGDIRKTLIDYSLNPNATELRNAEIEEKADSPFEVGVARALVDRGYHLVQQWKVGAYRLDMVVVCGNKTVAIECDGERYHSGESKVREDMERQTILERLGWRFIRIRGSEYFRNPEKTMDRVIQELTNYDIHPDSGDSASTDTNVGYELLDRVKHRAALILSNVESSKEAPVDLDTISAALDPKSIVSETPRNNPTIPKVNIKSKAKGPSRHSAPTIEKENVQIELSRMRTSENAIDIIIEYLDKINIPYVDSRSENGFFWVIGGNEISSVIALCESLGVKFIFAPKGRKATKGLPGWYSCGWYS